MMGRYAQPLIAHEGPWPCNHCDGTSNGIEFMTGMWSCCLGALLETLTTAPLIDEQPAETEARLEKRRRQFTAMWNAAVSRKEGKS